MDTEPSQTRTRPRFRYASMDERSFYEIAATASAPELANTPASSSKQAARATPKGLVPPALYLILQNRAVFVAMECKSTRVWFYVAPRVPIDQAQKNSLQSNDYKEFLGVPYGIRTHDIQNHNLTL